MSNSPGVVNRRGVLAIVLALLIVAGCGGEAVTLGHDANLDRKLTEVAEQGRTVELGSLIDGEWDEVKVFAMDASSKRTLEKEIGQEIDAPDYFIGKGSVVFVLTEKRVVRGLTLDNYLQPGSYRKSTRVVGDSTEKRVRLVDG
ncbi:hypothetical protein SUDANB95_04868 [Actinosynnema sp. ALI-1.44]